MIKKLILFLTITLMSFNVSFANDSKVIYVEQFNTVKIGVPSIVRCEPSEGYSIQIDSEKEYLYKIAIIKDTLVVLPYCTSDYLHLINPEDVIITLKHPNPKKVINELKLNCNSLRKTKSGNLKK